MIWLKRMFFEYKIKVEPLNMTGEEDEKVEAKDEVEAEEETEVLE